MLHSVLKAFFFVQVATERTTERVREKATVFTDERIRCPMRTIVTKLFGELVEIPQVEGLRTEMEGIRAELHTLRRDVRELQKTPVA